MTSDFWPVRKGGVGLPHTFWLRPSAAAVPARKPATRRTISLIDMSA